MESHHPAKFGGHRPSASGDLMFQFCHVISQNHVIKGSCHFFGGSHSW